MSCRDSPHAQKFADMRKADSAYLLEHCTKSVPTPTPSPKPTKLYTTDGKTHIVRSVGMLQDQYS